MRGIPSCLLAAALVSAGIVSAAQPPAGVRLEGDAARRERLAQIQGKPAPELQVERWYNGKPVRLGDLRGKVVLLDFWGKW